MSVACSVCGQPVPTKDNLVLEHKTMQGKICYGSFTPANPIEFKELAVKKQRLGYSDSWDNTWISRNSDLNSLVGERDLNSEYNMEFLYSEAPKIKIKDALDEEQFLKELEQLKQG